jgi:hypothetical protein
MFPAIMPVLKSSHDPSTARPALAKRAQEKAGRFGRDDGGGAAFMSSARLCVRDDTTRVGGARHAVPLHRQRSPTPKERRMPGFPTPTNVVGVNANGRHPTNRGKARHYKIEEWMARSSCESGVKPPHSKVAGATHKAAQPAWEGGPTQA